MIGMSVIAVLSGGAAPVAAPPAMALFYYQTKVEVIQRQGAAVSSLGVHAVDPRNLGGIVFDSSRIAFGTAAGEVCVVSQGSGIETLATPGDVVGFSGSTVLVRPLGGDTVAAEVGQGPRYFAATDSRLMYTAADSSTVYSWYQVGRNILLAESMPDGKELFLTVGFGDLYRVDRIGGGKFVFGSRFGGELSVWLLDEGRVRRLWASAPDHADMFVDAGGRIIVHRYLSRNGVTFTTVSRLYLDGRTVRLGLLNGEYRGVDLSADGSILWALRVVTGRYGEPLVHVDVASAKATVVRNDVDVAVLLRNEGGWLLR